MLLQQIIKSYTDTDTDTRTCTLTRSTLTEQTRLRRIHSDVSWDEQWGLLNENIVGGARQGGVVGPGGAWWGLVGLGGAWLSLGSAWWG